MKAWTRRRREGLGRGVLLVPNLLTTASLFCGFYAVVKSLQGEFVTASWAILLAGVFDLLDGRIARFVQVESQFGIEYDSLVDLASFGLAPGILAYTWALKDLGRFGWLIAFVYFACGALRLARYNVQHDSIEKKYFQGLPIPMAAYTIATYVILHHYLFLFPPDKPRLAACGMLLLALLMVTKIPYRSVKTLDLGERESFFVLVGVVVAIAVVAIEPEIMMFALTASYVVSALVEELVTLRHSRSVVERVRSRKKRKDSDETWETKPTPLQ